MWWWHRALVDAQRLWLVVVMVGMAGLLFPTPARAQGVDILGQAQQQVQSGIDEQKSEVEARLAKLEKIQGKKQVRVVVLPWPESEVDEDNLILQAMVRSQIGRPNAQFYPALDLYQEGRRRLYIDGLPADPLDQPGAVPDELVDQVRSELSALQSRLGGRLDDLSIAGQLLPLIDAIWFSDRPATRELLFDLYVTVGRAVYHLRNQTPPYFRMVGPEHTNYYLYLAAAMLWEEEQAAGEMGDAPRLADRLPGGEIGDFVRSLVSLIDDGVHPPIPLAFHQGGMFDDQEFAKDFRVVINGVDRIVDGSGMVLVPRGRIHVFLQRSDGYSLSEYVEIQRLDEKIYFVMDVAKQKMGYDLLNQLMMYPNECTPDLDSHTRASLATYAALHPKDEIYVAIPKAGSPYQTYVWRWEAQTGQLHLLLDRNRGFPIRFALLGSTGLFFNGASLDTAQIEQLTQLDPTTVAGGGLGSVASIDDLQRLVRMEVAGLPVDFQLRGQFNRLMIGFGAQLALNLSRDGGGLWTERYQTDGNLVIDRPDPVDPEADPVEVPVASLDEVLHQERWSRQFYGQIGVFLLKDASMGIGPRIFAQVGGLNMPHAVSATAHLGMTTDPTFGRKEYKGRMVPLIDVDLFAGALFPTNETVFVTGRLKNELNPSAGFRKQVMPTLGFTLGTGFSF